MIAKLLFGKVANSLLQIKEVECFTQDSKYILEKVKKKKNYKALGSFNIKWTSIT